MYIRKIDDKEIIFGHAGMLYRNSFIMYDKGTESLWIHVTGQAVTGKMRGKKLKFFPSIVTSWDTWRKLYPDTKVASGKGRGGFMGTYKGIKDIEGLGLSVVINGNSKLYQFSDLEKNQIINDLFMKNEILVVFSKSAMTAIAWSRKVDKDSLEFEFVNDNKCEITIQDKKTKSIWNALTGKAIEGNLKGNSLEPISSTPILVSRWKGFYPKGEHYKPRDERGEDE